MQELKCGIRAREILVLRIGTRADNGLIFSSTSGITVGAAENWEPGVSASIYLRVNLMNMHDKLHTCSRNVDVDGQSFVVLVRACVPEGAWQLGDMYNGRNLILGLPSTSGSGSTLASVLLNKDSKQMKQLTAGDLFEIRARAYPHASSANIIMKPMFVGAFWAKSQCSHRAQCR